MEGILHITAAFNRWNDDECNVNVNRNDNDWNDNWWFAGLAISSFMPMTLLYSHRKEIGFVISFHKFLIFSRIG